MLPLKALRAQVLAMSAPQFKTRFGQVALVQSPPEPMLRLASLKLAGAQTVNMADRTKLGDRLLLMMTRFEDLSVQFLKPERDGDAFTVGRLPTCAVQISDPSVSKHHATLRWAASRGGCTVQDERSTNGTFAGSSKLGTEEKVLLDGDALGFGDAQFVYLLTETLYEQLRMTSFGYG